MRTARTPGSCSEVYLSSWRLLPARSPNTAWGPNLSVAKGPWHSVTGILEETVSCSRESTSYHQDCPAVDREGFVISGEMDEDWGDLEQTQVVVFHSWIAEYARVANVSQQGGRQEVRLREPLQHAAVGEYVKSGGWRFLVVNNRAVLDQEGEVVCVQEGEEAVFSYISPAGLEQEVPVLGQLEVLLNIQDTQGVQLRWLTFQHTSSGGGRDGYNWGAQVDNSLTLVHDNLPTPRLPYDW